MSSANREFFEVDQYPRETVVPAQAGIQYPEQCWIPACAGMTGMSLFKPSLSFQRGSHKIMTVQKITRTTNQIRNLRRMPAR